MATTVEYLIYALGGGHGHARRGLLLQQRLAERGIASTVLLRPGSDHYFKQGAGPRHYALSIADPHLAPLLRELPPRLVVDTFPNGWSGEIGPDFLSRFAKTFLVARYSRSLPEPMPQYDGTLLPYPEGRDEWGSSMMPGHHAGYMIDASHLSLAGGGREFAVVDSEGRCGERLLSVFARLARRAGLAFSYQRRLDGIMRVAKLLVVGAGYHTFYELLGKGLDVRFVPVKKRYDDQFRRTSLFGLELAGLDQLPAWLSEPVSAPSVSIRTDWDRAMRLLEA